MVLVDIIETSSFEEDKFNPNRSYDPQKDVELLQAVKYTVHNFEIRYGNLD